MHPSKFGDTYDIAKLSMLPWLARIEGWFYHPMYFPGQGEVYDEAFPGRFADFLGVPLVDGNIGDRCQLVNSVAGNPGHLFLDPDIGLWNGDRDPECGWDKHISMRELARIANVPVREHWLTLVYDQSYSYYIGDAVRRQRVKRKLQTLWDVHRVHGVAYVSHVPVIWASTDPITLSVATQRFLRASRLPESRLVDDGSGYIPRPRAVG